MAYTLGEAARATGRAKPTIARAIEIGRISAVKSDTGAWQIEPAELHRVYPMTGQTNGQMLRDLPGEPAGAPAGATLAELQAERRLTAEQAESIRDLRARLDASEDERRRVQERLTALLTGPRRSWWRTWRR